MGQGRHTLRSISDPVYPPLTLSTTIPLGRCRPSCTGRTAQTTAVVLVSQPNHRCDSSIPPLCSYYSCHQAERLNHYTAAVQIADTK